MSIEVRPVRTRRERAAFIEVPWKTCGGDPNWVPPLRFDVRERINPRKNPFFEYGEAELFVAWKDGEPVGRISAHLNPRHEEIHGERMGFFGFFDAPDDVDVARALFDAAAGWLAERGRPRMRGPMSFTINDEIGVLVAGYDTPPMLLMTHNPPYYPRLFDECGFEKAKDLLAWHYDTRHEVPERARRLAALVEARDDVRLRMVERRQLDRDVRIVLDVFNDAWADNWGFVPLSEAELRKAVQEFRLVLEPRLAWIAEVDGEPAAIAVALPNIHEAIADLDGRLFPLGLAKLLWRVKVRHPRTARLLLLGIRKKFRTPDYFGLSFLLYETMHEQGRQLGYEEGELSWTLEDNRHVNRGIEWMGGRIYKRYRIYERAVSA